MVQKMRERVNPETVLEKAYNPQRYTSAVPVYAYTHRSGNTTIGTQTGVSKVDADGAVGG